MSAPVTKNFCNWTCQLTNFKQLIQFESFVKSFIGGKKMVNIKDMQELAKKNGLEKTGVPGMCLSKLYVNDKTHLIWKCGKCSYEWKAQPNHIKRQRWCPKCAGNLKKTIKDMQKLAEEMGILKTGVAGKFLSKIYINNRTNYKWQCGKCKHVWMATPTNIKKKRWCKECIPNDSLNKMEEICRRTFEKIFNSKFPSKSPIWLINPL